MRPLKQECHHQTAEIMGRNGERSRETYMILVKEFPLLPLLEDHERSRREYPRDSRAINGKGGIEAKQHGRYGQFMCSAKVMMDIIYNKVFLPHYRSQMLGVGWSTPTHLLFVPHLPPYVLQAPIPRPGLPHLLVEVSSRHRI